MTSEFKDLNLNDLINILVSPISTADLGTCFEHKNFWKQISHTSN